MQNVFSNKNRNISQKITQVILIIAICSSIIIGLVGILNIVVINNDSDQVYTQNLTPLLPLYKVTSDFTTVRVSVRDLILNSGDPVAKQNGIDAALTDIDKQLAAYESYLSSPEEKSNFQTIKKAVSDYINTKNEVLKYLALGDRGKATAQLNGTAAKALDSAVSKAFNLNISQAQQRNQNSTFLFYFALILITAIAGALILSPQRSVKKFPKISPPRSTK